MGDRKLTQFAKKLLKTLPYIHKELMKIPGNELTRVAISLPQMTILDYLYEHKKCTMGDISGLLLISMSASTGLADRMIKNKLLARKRCLRDRRVVWISITQKGKKLALSIKKFKYAMIKRLFKKISVTDRKRYLDIINKICKGLLDKKGKQC